MQKGKYLIALGIALSVICSAYLISLGIRHFSGGDPVVRVTGGAERQIVSDLAVVNITLHQQASTQAEAYKALQRAESETLKYLKEQGFTDKDIKRGSVSSLKGLGENNKDDSYYSRDRKFNGYRLSESIQLSSNHVDKVETLIANISQLLSQNIEVEVGNVAYYYTKLNELKVEMLKEASANALSRASIIAEGGKGKLGKLKGISMGVFQVLGLNEPEDSYSWGGTLNTSNKEKVASVTVKATYILD